MKKRRHLKSTKEKEKLEILDTKIKIIGTLIIITLEIIKVLID